MCLRAALLLGLMLAAAGCLSDDGKLATVNTGGLFGSGRTRSASFKQAPKATLAMAQRVQSVGQKLVAANPSIKQRIAFLPVGAPQEEIFHQTNKNVSTIVITEGLVKQCKSDGELAAVLSQAMGKIVSEQMAVEPPRRGWTDRSLVMNARIGNDYNGTFGTPDGTDQMIAARAEKEGWVQSPLPTPTPPESLARTFLQSAGFDANNLSTVNGLLRKAGKNNTLEQSMSGKWDG